MKTIVNNYLIDIISAIVYNFKMTFSLTQHFSEHMSRGSQKQAFIRRLEYVQKTPIGRALLESFYESGGRIEYHGTIPGAAGRYNYKTNVVQISNDGTSSCLVHELAHARQEFLWSREDYLRSSSRTLSSDAHRSVVAEADAWALEAVFFKQFIRENCDDSETLDLFFKREKERFRYFRKIDPVSLPHNGKQKSQLELDVDHSILAIWHRKHGDGEIIPRLDDLMQDVMSEETDLNWAKRVYKNSFDRLDFKDSASARYAIMSIDKAFLTLIEKFSFEKHIEKIERDCEKTNPIPPKLLEDNLRRWADLRDLGINGSYLQGINDLTWATIPHPIYADFIRKSIKDFGDFAQLVKASEAVISPA